MSKVDVVKVVRVRKYHNWGYEVRDELWDAHFEDSDKPLLMKRNAYNLEGDWIGKSRFAYRLFHRRGIYPQKSNPEHCICTIGFSKRLKKWFGWSHRAICGFGLGDRIFEEKYGNDDTPFIRHGRMTITTMNQAKLSAVRFAASVS